MMNRIDFSYQYVWFFTTLIIVNFVIFQFKYTTGTAGSMGSIVGAGLLSMITYELIPQSIRANFFLSIGTIILGVLLGAVVGGFLGFALYNQLT